MNTNKYAVVLTAYEYSILNKNFLISATCHKQLESATTYEQGKEKIVELLMTLDELEDLTGYVAAESNHAKTAKQSRELGTICDAFEARISEIKGRLRVNAS